MCLVLLLPVEGRFACHCSLFRVSLWLSEVRLATKSSCVQDVEDLNTTLKKWPFYSMFAAGLSSSSDGVKILSDHKNVQTFPHITEKSGRCEISVRVYLARQISGNFSSVRFVIVWLLFNSSSEHLSHPLDTLLPL